jgi:glycolate oxidase FAD binding subunit
MSTTLIRDQLAPANETELAQIVTASFARKSPLYVQGGGTRVQYAHPEAMRLTTSAMAGVVTYEPGEMTLIARTGTPVSEIEDLVAAEGQSLAFEPQDMRGLLGTNGTPTIGGIVAANSSGPRRLQVGACRDHLLGVRFVDGQGRILKNGGRVMKNVTGLDLSKLLAGSYGTLGVITQVALKTLPLAPARATLAFHDLDRADAVRLFSDALATPFEVTGAAWRDGSAYLRIEGLEKQALYRRERLLSLFRDRKIEELDGPATVALWRELRDVAHFAGSDTPLWRVMVKPTEAAATANALEALGGRCSLDWGGGLLWYAGPGNPDAVRRAAAAGHATLIRRGTLQGPAFQPQGGGLAMLAAGLRNTFDPAGILNPGLMDA